MRPWLTALREGAGGLLWLALWLVLAFLLDRARSRRCGPLRSDGKVHAKQAAPGLRGAALEK
jgi:hypothetical protein